MKNTKKVWIENLVLLNKCVQNSGGTMTIVGSHTETNGSGLTLK